MKTKLLEIFKTHPLYATRLIKKDCELWNWVLENSDPNCIEYKTQIYTAITGEKVKCPCGSDKLRRFISFERGLAFCGNGQQCSAAHTAQCINTKKAALNWDKEKARVKRINTNFEKYGVANAGQTIQAIETRKRLYADPTKVAEILNKMTQTNLDRYGVKHNMHENISKFALDILLNKEAFTEKLLTHGLLGLSKLLVVWPTTISSYHKKYELSILNPNANSSYEVECKYWLDSLGINNKKDRTVCKPQELDIYIPSHNLAIEFDGLYWHSENMGKDKHYHINKTKKCQEQGIQLIHIFEDEWIERKEVCKSIISNYLNQPKPKIPGRKCTLKEVDNNYIKSFLNSNHLQGYATASINLILEYNDDIVMAMTFRPSRYNKKIQYELVRLDSKINTHIVGGTQKLWSYFLKTHNPNSIVSYCDRRWFSGHIYEKLGFNKVTVAKPGYWYTNGVTRFHRSKFTKKSAIKESLKMIGNSHSVEELNALSENQITKNILGLNRIWDCGQDTWIWKK